MGRPSKYGRSFGLKESIFGSNTNGHKVQSYGGTTGKYFKWNPTTNVFEVAGDLEVSAQFLKGQRFFVQYPQVAAADVAKTFWMAPAACKIISARERHVTVAGQAGVLNVEKLASGEAPAGGAVTLTTGWDLTSAANIPVSIATIGTAAATLAAGDALCLKLTSGAATSYALGTIMIEMEWL